MDALVLDRVLSEDDWTAISERWGKDCIVYSKLSQHAPKGIDVRVSTTFSTDENKQIDEDIKERLLLFSQVKEGRDLFRYWNHEAFHLWFYHRFRLYNSVRAAFRLDSYFEELLKETDSLVYIGPTNPLIQKRGDSISCWEIPKQRVSSKAKQQLRYLFICVIRFLQHILVGKRKVKALILNNAMHEHPLLGRDGESADENLYLGYLLHDLPVDMAVLDEVPIPDSSGNITSKRLLTYPFKNKRVFFNEAVLLRQVFRIGTWWKMKTIGSRWKDSYTVETKDEFTALILHYLKQWHSTSLFYLFRYLAYKNCFKNWGLMSVACIGENNSLNKIVLDAASFSGIRSVGIQHGTIHSANLNYTYSKTDWNYHPAPDLTLVWGEYWKKALLDIGNYPDERVKVTGQIRADIIPVLQKIDQEKQQDFTVVFASQPFREEGQRIEVLEEVIRAVKGLEDVHLTIRPHPIEKDDFFFLKFLEKHQLSNFSIERKEDLYKSLSKCDVLLTCYSTVGAEVIYFEKPLITFDPLKHDLQDYVKEEVAVSVKNASEIRQVILDFKDGSRSINKEAYNRFIRKYAFQVDGKACERVMNELNQL